MKITCSGSNKKTGKPCSRKVVVDGDYCYQHSATKQVNIPEDISQVVGRKPVVIDDIDEDGNQIIPPKEVFESVIGSSKNISVHSTDTIFHGNANTAYLPDNIEHLEIGVTYKITFWERIKNKFSKRGNKDE